MKSQGQHSAWTNAKKWYIPLFTTFETSRSNCSKVKQHQQPSLQLEKSETLKQNKQKKTQMYLSRGIFTRQFTAVSGKLRSAINQNGVWDSHQPSRSRGYEATSPFGSGWQSDIERAAEEGYMGKERERYCAADERKKSSTTVLIHPDNTSSNAAAHCAIKKQSVKNTPSFSALSEPTTAAEGLMQEPTWKGLLNN